MIALLLEGGGIRCAFTAGVLDSLLENNICFDNIYAVSAASYVAASFVSGQKGRFLTAKLGRKSDTSGSAFDQDVYNSIIKFDGLFTEFDYEAFKKSSTNLFAVVTESKTGDPEYIKMNDVINQSCMYKIMAASSSIPGKSRTITINYKNYFDGGFADAIPLFKAMEDKNNKFIAVLSRSLKYYKEKSEVNEDFAKKFITSPKLIDLIETRYRRYNDSKRVLNYLIDEGKAIALYPDKVDELDASKFDYKIALELYREGYLQAQKLRDDIKGMIG